LPVRKDREVSDNEKALAVERAKMETLIEKMDSKTRESYLVIKNETEGLNAALNQIQAEMNNVDVLERSLSQASSTQVKWEILNLLFGRNWKTIPSRSDGSSSKQGWRNWESSEIT
jgi:hypothetical protein